MKVTNKSELMKAAWKMFNNPKFIKTFSEALKIAWTFFKEYLKKQSDNARQSVYGKEFKKALYWAQSNVARLGTILDFSEWEKYYTAHKSEGTVWQVVAKFARNENAIAASFY